MSTLPARFLALEIRRALRNGRFAMFAVVFPVGFFLLFAQLYGDGHVHGTTGRAYLMVSMAMFGGIGATLNGGGRIAVERKMGWNRLLRLTPLSPRAYVLTRLVTSMALAVPSFVLVFLAARFVEGVRLPLDTWLSVSAYFVLMLVPFAVLGIGLGYLMTADSAPMIGGALSMVLSLFGGVWIPVDQMPDGMLSFARSLPSYWFGVAARSPLTHEQFGAQGILVMAVWVVGLGAFAARRYRRDPARA